MKILTEKQTVLYIRLLTLFFMAALVLSGVTAFPLETELRFLTGLLSISPNVPPETYTGLHFWLARVLQALIETNKTYPFLAYGTDWLAFAHIVIAVLFIGFFAKPVRNQWIIYFGMIACAGIIPLALICGHLRGIPFYWQMIDCSFGIFGFVPLYFLYILVKKLEKMTNYPKLKY
ncbi:hypothetical protein FACS1894180_4210 [Bacteroidia bacterium]|nr:hypothetical protein FACS1894180_4210 [Bacteroidia bacterium]